MRIKSLAEIVSKWVKNAAAATGFYKSGLQSPRRPWQEATLDAADAYAAGVQEAISNNLFSKGVSATSNADWVERAITVGAPRYATGVSASQNRYNRGFAPYHAALSSMQLPPRGPRGSSQNYDRVRQIGEELHRIRISGAA